MVRGRNGPGSVRADELHQTEGLEVRPALGQCAFGAGKGDDGSRAEQGRDVVPVLGLEDVGVHQERRHLGIGTDDPPAPDREPRERALEGITNGVVERMSRHDRQRRTNRHTALRAVGLDTNTYTGIVVRHTAKGTT